MDLPINKSEIVVKERGKLWVVKSHHAEHINLLTRRKTLDRVDLLCLTDLGFKIKYENK